MVRGSRIIGLLMLVVSAALPSVGQCQAEASIESETKAEFIYNFARFVQWPESRFADSTSPILIGVLGVDPFDGALEKSMAGKTAQGRPIRFLKSADICQADSCHILYVEKGLRPQFQNNLQRFAKHGVLTVGDWPGFAGDGGVIGFISGHGGVEFEVRSDFANLGKFAISSKLLRVGRVVSPKTSAR